MMSAAHSRSRPMFSDLFVFRVRFDLACPHVCVCVFVLVCVYVFGNAFLCLGGKPLVFTS